MKLKAAPYSAPYPSYCISEPPAIKEQQNNVLAGPHRVTVHSGHPILHHHRGQHPQCIRGNGLKEKQESEFSAATDGAKLGDSSAQYRPLAPSWLSLPQHFVGTIPAFLRRGYRTPLIQGLAWGAPGLSKANLLGQPGMTLWDTNRTLICSRRMERGAEHMTGTGFLPRALSASKTVRTVPVLPRASPGSSSQLFLPFLSASTSGKPTSASPVTGASFL